MEKVYSRRSPVPSSRRGPGFRESGVTPRESELSALLEATGGGIGRKFALVNKEKTSVCSPEVEGLA